MSTLLFHKLRKMPKLLQCVVVQSDCTGFYFIFCTGSLRRYIVLLKITLLLFFENKHCPRISAAFKKAMHFEA